MRSDTESRPIQGWWISWYDVPGELNPDEYGFTLDDSLTWITGTRMSDSAATVVACIHVTQASNVKEAEQSIEDRYEDVSLLPLEFRFCDPIYEGDKLPWEHEGSRFSSNHVPVIWKKIEDIS